MSGNPPYHNLTLYVFGTGNGNKTTITLEELGVQYKAQTIDIRNNMQKEPWFWEINPNGRIPALKDGNLRIFESGAIMLYLTDHYDPDNKISYPHGTPLYYEMLSWLMWQMGGLGPMQGQANHFRAMAPVYSSYGIQRYTDETKRLHDVLESRLSHADWLAGDKYTIADIASFAWVRGSGLLGLDINQWPGVAKWVQRIAERPAVVKGLKIPEGSLTMDDFRGLFKTMSEKVDAMKGTEKQDS